MSYFDLDYGSKYRIKMPEAKMEAMDWRTNSSFTEYERMVKKMANINTGWNSHWTQDIDSYSEIVENEPISSDEIKQYLPEEYKELSLEELSEKLLEDDNGQEVLKEAINKAKSRNVKEKKSDDYEELLKLVKEYQDQQQYQYDKWTPNYNRPNPPYYTWNSGTSQ